MIVLFPIFSYWNDWLISFNYCYIYYPYYFYCHYYLSPFLCLSKGSQTIYQLFRSLHSFFIFPFSYFLFFHVTYFCSFILYKYVTFFALSISSLSLIFHLSAFYSPFILIFLSHFAPHHFSFSYTALSLNFPMINTPGFKNRFIL